MSEAQFTASYEALLDSVRRLSGLSATTAEELSLLASAMRSIGATGADESSAAALNAREALLTAVATRVQDPKTIAEDLSQLSNALRALEPMSSISEFRAERVLGLAQIKVYVDNIAISHRDADALRSEVAGFRDTAKTYRDSASQSASNADSSEDAANASKLASAQSESNASASAQAAASSETTATEAKADALAARDRAESAKVGIETARDAASDSARAAAGSAASAKTSEDNALAAKDAAEAASARAEQVTDTANFYLKSEIDGFLDAKATVAGLEALDNELAAALASLDSELTEAMSDLDLELTQKIHTFIARTDNPHQVTKAQIGLSNADDTADDDKPVSNAQQAAINAAVAPLVVGFGAEELGFIDGDADKPYLGHDDGSEVRLARADEIVTEIRIQELIDAAALKTDAIKELINDARIGDIVMLPGTAIPAGRRILKLNGALVSRTTYAKLWAYAQASGNLAASSGAKRSNQFGPGDGSTTFALPDYRGYFVRGFDDGRGLDEGRVFSEDQLGSNAEHTHLASAVSAGGHTHSGSTSSAGWHGHSGSTDSSGNHTHSGYTDVAGNHNHSVSQGNTGFRSGSSASGFAVQSGMGWTHTGINIDAGGNHQHSVTTHGAGSHSHNLSINGDGEHSHSMSLNAVGDHTHTVTVTKEGDEARPMNIAATFGIYH